MASEDIVFALQGDVFGRLGTWSFFDDVVLVRNERGVLQSDIDAELATMMEKTGKTGAALVVDRPYRRVEFPDIPGPEWKIRIPVSAFEWPEVNRGESGTGKTIEQLVSETCAALHQFFIADIGCQIVCASDNVIPSQNKDRLLYAEIWFEATLGQAMRAKTGIPRIAVDGGSVTLTSATAGASIRYTLDGTFPGADAPLYSVAFDAVSGEHVRAIAYSDDRVPSDLAAKLIP